MYFVVKGTVARDLPPFHQKYPPRSMIHILSWFHIYLFGFIFGELLEFKSDSCIRKWGVIMQPGVKSKNCRRLPGPLKGQSGKKITWGTYYLHRSFWFLWNKIKRTGEKISWNSFCNGKRYKNKVMRNFVTPKSHGIPRNSAEFYEFRNTEFRVIPRNLGQFRILYGIYGSKKNIRNSV